MYSARFIFWKLHVQRSRRGQFEIFPEKHFFWKNDSESDLEDEDDVTVPWGLPAEQFVDFMYVDKEVPYSGTTSDLDICRSVKPIETGGQSDSEDEADDQLVALPVTNKAALGTLATLQRFFEENFDDMHNFGRIQRMVEWKVFETCTQKKMSEFFK